MGAVTCRACGQGESVAICSDSGIPICANCAVSCGACGSPVNRELAQLTSTGRKLCPKCMVERAARRRAKKDEVRRDASSPKRESSQGRPAAAGGGVAGASFEDLMRDDAQLSQTFKGIMRAEAPAPPKAAGVPKSAGPQKSAGPPKSAGTSFEELVPKAKAAGPQKKAAKAAVRGSNGVDLDDASAKTFGLEGQAQEGSRRLSLGPIDDNRPILGQSGHQPPSKKAYLAAFCLFGLAAAIFFTILPGFRSVLFPGQSTTPQFMSNQMPLATDSNALRNTSNVNQFDLFSQAPIFFVAWLFVGTYAIGFLLIVWSVGRSLMSSYLAKRRLKRAEEYAKKHGYSYPG